MKQCATNWLAQKGWMARPPTHKPPGSHREDRADQTYDEDRGGDRSQRAQDHLASLENYTKYFRIPHQHPSNAATNVRTRTHLPGDQRYPDTRAKDTARTTQLSTSINIPAETMCLVSVPATMLKRSPAN